MVQSASTLLVVLDADQSEYAGNPLLQEGEALRSHPGLYLADLSVVANFLCNNLACEFCAGGIVVNREASLAQGIEGNGAVISSSDAFYHAAEFCMIGNTYQITVEQTDSTAEGQVVGDNVALQTGVQYTYRQSQRLEGADLGQTGSLQCVVDSYEAVDGAVGLVRTGTMTALAMDGNIEAHSSGHGVAGVDGNLAGFQSVVEVNAPDSVSSNAVLIHISQAVVDAGSDLLRALEEQNDLTSDLVLMSAQDLGSAQQHSHMAVMTAGVHNAVHLGAAYTGTSQVVLGFLYRQRIAVCTQQNSLAPAGLGAFDEAQQTAVGDLLIGNTHTIQLLLYTCKSGLFLIGQLRILVEMPTHGYYIRIDFFCQFIYLHFTFLLGILLTNGCPFIRAQDPAKDHALHHIAILT